MTNDIKEVIKKIHLRNSLFNVSKILTIIIYIDIHKKLNLFLTVHRPLYFKRSFKNKILFDISLILCFIFIKILKNVT